MAHHAFAYNYMPGGKPENQGASATPAAPPAPKPEDKPAAPPAPAPTPAKTPTPAPAPAPAPTPAEPAKPADTRPQDNPKHEGFGGDDDQSKQTTIPHGRIIHSDLFSEAHGDRHGDFRADLHMAREADLHPTAHFTDLDYGYGHTLTQPHTIVHGDTTSYSDMGFLQHYVPHSEHTTRHWDGPIEHDITVVDEEPIYKHATTKQYVTDKPIVHYQHQYEKVLEPARHSYAHDYKVQKEHPVYLPKQYEHSVTTEHPIPLHGDHHTAEYHHTPYHHIEPVGAPHGDVPASAHHGAFYGLGGWGHDSYPYADGITHAQGYVHPYVPHDFPTVPHVQEQIHLQKFPFVETYDHVTGKRGFGHPVNQSGAAPQETNDISPEVAERAGEDIAAFLKGLGIDITPQDTPTTYNGENEIPAELVEPGQREVVNAFLKGFGLKV